MAISGTSLATGGQYQVFADRWPQGERADTGRHEAMPARGFFGAVELRLVEIHLCGYLTVCA
jgi:hypothetical protein